MKWPKKAVVTWLICRQGTTNRKDIDEFRTLAENFFSEVVDIEMVYIYSLK